MCFKKNKEDDNKLNKIKKTNAIDYNQNNDNNNIINVNPISIKENDEDALD